MEPPTFPIAAFGVGALAPAGLGFLRRVTTHAELHRSSTPKQHLQPARIAAQGPAAHAKQSGRRSGSPPLLPRSSLGGENFSRQHVRLARARAANGPDALVPADSPAALHVPPPPWECPRTDRNFELARNILSPGNLSAQRIPNWRNLRVQIPRHAGFGRACVGGKRVVTFAIFTSSSCCGGRVLLSGGRARSDLALGCWSLVVLKGLRERGGRMGLFSLRIFHAAHWSAADREGWSGVEWCLYGVATHGAA